MTIEPRFLDRLCRMTGTTRETKAWQEAVGLAGDIIRLVRRVTRRETKAFTDALMLSASAAASAIAEAPVRPTAAEERECYARARRSLVAVETQLAIARNSGIIAASTHAQLTARVAALSHRVQTHMHFAERHAAAVAERSPAASLPLLADTS
jgi:four helix bundle protein